MTPPPRREKATAAPRRPGITLDSDALRFASGGEPAPAAPAAPPASTAPPTIDPAELEAREGEAFPGEELEKVGTTLPSSLLDQIEGLMRFVEEVEIPGITYKADVYRIALHRFLTQCQNEYNDGKPFMVPRRRRRS